MNKKMKLFIAEDEKRLAFYLKKALEQEGYITYCQFNGIDAFHYIENTYEDLDAVILDISLPGMSGIEICKQMRSHNITLPILMLTARDTEKDKIIGLDSGADDYITKPFSLKELFARIRSVTRRAKGRTNGNIIVKDIIINTASMKVFKNDVEVSLTLREYELLKFLASHPNVALNREQILERVWDINFNSFSNVVDVHINGLRKKIHDTTKPYMIESVRGVGYRINA